MLKGTRHEAILKIVALHDTFHEWPLLKAPITPVLSPLTVMSQQINLVGPSIEWQLKGNQFSPTNVSILPIPIC